MWLGGRVWRRKGVQRRGLSRIKDEFTRMECIEHITYIGYNVMNEDGI